MTTEYLVRRELEHVLAALMPANRLVCRVCLDTGLRVGDVVGLRTDQLAPQFWITEQKTKKRRRVNLSGALLDQLRAQAGPVWVFSGARDQSKHRTRQAVWADVKRARKRLSASPRMWGYTASARSMRSTRCAGVTEISGACRGL